MILEQMGEISLPGQAGSITPRCRRRPQLYVAHTANNALDVIDGKTTTTYARSVQGLDAVAGARVSEEHDLVFSSNRGGRTPSGSSRSAGRKH
jgi:hypothetical protein